MTRSVTNNQNTKSVSCSLILRKVERMVRILKNQQANIYQWKLINENKENVSDYKVEQKHKGIVPCRVLIRNCLSKEGERKNPWSKPESVYKTYKQAGEPLKYIYFEFYYALNTLLIIYETTCIFLTDFGQYEYLSIWLYPPCILHIVDLTIWSHDIFPAGEKYL